MAKFEGDGRGLIIAGREGSRKVLGMLMMTFGLVESVKLAHPREWVAFLDRERYQAVVQAHTEAIMQHAEYESSRFFEEESVYGYFPHRLGFSADGATLDECQQNLAQEISDWVLLRVIWGEEVPDFRKPEDGAAYDW